jgi:hypothetical protein
LSTADSEDEPVCLTHLYQYANFTFMTK